MTGRKTGTIQTQLIGWFLAVGLLPLIMVSVLSYQQSKLSLEDAASAELRNTAVEKARYINNWFDYRWMDLKLQANNPTNITLLEVLRTGFVASEMDLTTYTRSQEWDVLASSRRLDLVNVLSTYDYMYDLFLIDNSGNILFTIREESDLGTNLFTGPLQHSRFAFAVAQALEQNQAAFSDYEHYAPSDGLLSGFLAAPLRDEEGATKGVFAIQIRLDRINTLLSKEQEADINHYLVGQDGLLRSQFSDNKSEVLSTRISTDLFQNWLQSSREPFNDNGADALPILHHYKDPGGEAVIGLSTTIKIANVRWALITEIKLKTALSSINWLARVELAMLLVSAIVIILAATYLARRLSKPIAALNKAVEAFTHYNNTTPVQIRSRNEISNLAENFNVMMAARERYEKRIQQSEARAVAALNELNEQQFALSRHAIVAVTDIRGTITYVNTKFEEISGYSSAELVGSNHRMLNSGYHPKSFFRDMYLTISKGEAWNAEICNRAKNGELYWVATTIAPLRDEHGTIDHYMSIRTDITHQKMVQNQLRQAKEAAEEGAKAKSEFLATMSHEIRTPMNGVLGMLGLLMRTKLTADQQHQARLAMSSADSLLVIINDILDFSKIEAGRLDIEHIDFDLSSMLGDFTESMAPRAHEKGLELILDVVGIEHSMVQGDPGRLRQIMANLVSNAIKFTEQGEVVITAALHTTSDYKYRFDCTVSDTGIGIPESRIEYIFGSFTQVDASTTRRYGGTGLGLAIVKQLCSLMGGDIHVSSTQDQGSQFHFYIMLEPSQLSRAAVPCVDIKNIPMLVVDDNATNREVLKRQLELWGARVDLANNGAEALQLMQSKLEQTHEPTYAVAFLDMLMPDMDGAALGHQIRIKPALNPTKLIMMTSIGNRGDANRLADIGFDGYFPKPTTMSDLLNALAVLIDDGEALAQAKPLVTHHYLKSLQLEQSPTDAWPEHCRLMLVEDNPINQSVVQGMLEEINLHCELASDGREAIELLQNAESKYPYTLLLMDCQMPGMDGYETTRQIRAGNAGRRNQAVPILAMTANAMAGDREKCLEAGMNDYMSKPINIDELYQKLRMLLNGEQSDTPIATVAKPSNQPSLWDHTEALKRVRNKPERLNMLLDMFMESAPSQIEQIRQALTQEDYTDAAHAAHTLKGVAGNLSAHRLMRAAEKLEFQIREGEIESFTSTVENIIRQHDKLRALFQAHLQNGEPAPPPSSADSPP